MDLNDARMLAELHIEHHLDGSWTFIWTRSKRAFGRCSYRDRTIGLSSILTAIEDEEHVEDTILHEIAHALAGPKAGHGRMWKAVASSIGATPCARGKSSASAEAQPEPTWVMIIEGTDEIIRKYYRAPTKKRIAQLANRWLVGRKEETRGKLKIIPYAAYQNIKS